MSNNSKIPNATNSDLGMHWKRINIDGNGTSINSETLANNRLYLSRTVAGKTFEEMCAFPIAKAQPCGDGVTGAIWRALKKFFTFLKYIKKYYDKYVNGAMNILKNLQGEIRQTISEISAALRSLIQRIREWILNKIRKGIEDLLNSILPPLMKQIKSGVLRKIIDEIFCKFEDIIAGLTKFVGEFLYSLVGQVINVPLCVAENFISALLNKLANDIDQALKPIFDQINDILGGITQIAGSVFEAIDFILGFEGFLCDRPNCPEIKEFTASLDGGLKNSPFDSFAKFDLSGNVQKTTTQWMNDFFGKSDGSYVFPGGCYGGTFECGIPQVVIFGGGGSGAIAQAVVNNIGQVIGANMLSRGTRYKSTPFVSIVDPAGCGKNASAYAVMETDDAAKGTKKIKEIVMVNTGIGYSSTSDILSPIIKSFNYSPNPVQINQAVTLSWEVENADTVSLGIPGNTNLPLVSQTSFSINSSNVSFAPGSNETTIRYVLTATKNIPNSSAIIVTKNLDVLISNFENTTDKVNEEINTNTPTIDKFSATPNILYQGQIFKLEWETTDATEVSLSVPGYGSLPVDGSASLVVPQNLTFSADGSNLNFNYTITAKNKNAPTGKQISTKEISITVVPPIESDIENNRFFTTNNTTGVATSLPVGSGVFVQLDNQSLSSGGENGIEARFNNDPITSGGENGTPLKVGGSGGTPVIINGVPLTAGGSPVVVGGVGGNIITSGGNVVTVGGTGGIPVKIGGTGGDPLVTATTTTTTNLNTITREPPTDYKNAISQISNIIVLNTGTGYTPNDTVDIVGGNKGGEFNLQLTPTGQIIGIQIVKRPRGFTYLPEIRINSDTGVGAKFKSVLEFVPVDQLTKQEELDAINSGKLVKIIDCVTR